MEPKLMLIHNGGLRIGGADLRCGGPGWTYKVRTPTSKSFTKFKMNLVKDGYQKSVP